MSIIPVIQRLGTLKLECLCQRYSSTPVSLPHFCSGGDSPSLVCWDLEVAVEGTFSFGTETIQEVSGKDQPRGQVLFKSLPLKVHFPNQLSILCQFLSSLHPSCKHLTCMRHTAHTQQAVLHRCQGLFTNRRESKDYRFKPSGNS